MQEISVVDFEFFCKLIKKKSGISLNKDKNYLIESRLNPVVKKYKLGSISGLISRLKIEAKEELLVEVIDAIATHESMFFRDSKPFEYLQTTLISKLLENRGLRSKITVWSAACSTGQEAISVAISLMEHPIAQYMDFEILATDIAPFVLDKGYSGIYSDFEVQRGLPEKYLKKYFTKRKDGWEVNQDLLSKIRYEKLNLVDDFSHLPKFDIILCRNVLIYFDLEQKASIIKRLVAHMEPYSYLIIGATESLMGINNKLTFLEDTGGILSFKK